MMTMFGGSAWMNQGLPLGALLLPVGALLLLAIMVVPGLSRPGVKVDALTKAAYCYIAQSVGVLLMTVGGLPVVYAVFSQQPLQSGTYLALLLIFILGGGVYLIHDTLTKGIDSASKAIPHALFFYTWKCIGLLVTLFAGLVLLLTLLANHGETGWWVTPVVLFVYGILLSWFTLESPGAAVAAHHSTHRTAKKPLKAKSRTMA